MDICPDNAMVNAIVWLSTGLQAAKRGDPLEGMLTYATEIRKPLGRLRDPKFIKKQLNS